MYSASLNMKFEFENESTFEQIRWMNDSMTHIDMNYIFIILEYYLRFIYNVH